MRDAIVDRLVANLFDDDDNEEEFAIIPKQRARDRVTLPLDPPEPNLNSDVPKCLI